MQKYQNSILSNRGLPIANASVIVTNYPSGTTAVVYSDNGITVATNPLITDVNGAFSFYAANGHYTLTISGAGFLTVSIQDVLLMDALPSDLPTTLPSSPGQIWNNGGSISVS